MFETSGTIDKKFYDKYIWLFYSSSLKFVAILWLFYIIFIALIGETLENLLLYSSTMFFILLAIILVAAKNDKKIRLKRLAEITGNLSYVHTSYFEEDGVVAKNNSLDSVTKLKYDNFVKLKKCKSVYFLITKANLFVPIFVENFSDKEKEELLKFLKSHLPNVKKF